MFSCHGSRDQSSMMSDLTLLQLNQLLDLWVCNNSNRFNILDLQMVNVTLRVLYRPDTARLPELYRYLGMDYDQRVLPSIVNEVLKSVIAQYNVSQLLT